MHAIRVASAVLLGVGALALAAAPGAVAVDGDVTPFGFGLRPSLVEPGDRIALHVDRTGGECEGRADGLLTGPRPGDHSEESLGGDGGGVPGCQARRRPPGGLHL
ncbi:hypothetical protein SHIRM173S_12757 [Streptomyces hirsutus]